MRKNVLNLMPIGSSSLQQPFVLETPVHIALLLDLQWTRPSVHIEEWRKGRFKIEQPYV